MLWNKILTDILWPTHQEHQCIYLDYTYHTLGCFWTRVEAGRWCFWDSKMSTVSLSQSAQAGAVGHCGQALVAHCNVVRFPNPLASGHSWQLGNLTNCNAAFSPTENKIFILLGVEIGRQLSYWWFCRKVTKYGLCAHIYSDSPTSNVKLHCAWDKTGKIISKNILYVQGEDFESCFIVNCSNPFQTQ